MLGGNLTGPINDAQHGQRGGGDLHDEATPSVSGFMSSTDKTAHDAHLIDLDIHRILNLEDTSYQAADLHLRILSAIRTVQLLHLICLKVMRQMVQAFLLTQRPQWIKLLLNSLAPIPTNLNYQWAVNK